MRYTGVMMFLPAGAPALDRTHLKATRSEDKARRKGGGGGLKAIERKKLIDKSK